MHINADFNQSAYAAATEQRWTRSTQQGVDRVMLDRIGDEKARATSIVRYAPKSFFPSHSHPGGEEILVLSGTFSDESGDYSEGWYLRNPPASVHQPFSEQGCAIFVKLWQMDDCENETVRINTLDKANWVVENGRAVCKLFENDSEVTILEKRKANESIFDNGMPEQPIELLVVDGSLFSNEKEFTKGSWLRLPNSEQTDIVTGKNGATIFLKQGEFKNTQLEVTRD
ncbi:cupin domain-containing protein [Thalassotalea montiporae]